MREGEAARAGGRGVREGEAARAGGRGSCRAAAAHETPLAVGALTVHNTPLTRRQRTGSKHHARVSGLRFGQRDC